MNTELTQAGGRVSRAMGLVAKALDRTRSEEERAEYTAEVLELLSGIAED